MMQTLVNLTLKLLSRPNLILGRLPLVPAGDHGTIPAAMRNSKSQLFKYGECNKDWRPGNGSKLYYINQWAMCWPSDHPNLDSEVAPDRLSLGAAELDANLKQTTCKPMPNQTKGLHVSGLQTYGKLCANQKRIHLSSESIKVDVTLFEHSISDTFLELELSQSH